VKLAVICPLGPLDRFGYQHTWKPCLESFRAFADKVYCVASEPDVQMPDVEMISGPETWFEDGFDVHQIVFNMNLGLDRAMADGMDVAACQDVNCYVPNGEAFRGYCESLLERERPYGWVYRKDQLGPVMFHVNGRRPRIFNLSYRWRVGMDCIKKNGKTVHYEIDEFPEKEAVAYVDCGLEMTLPDLEAKMNYIRCYHDLVPKRKPVFDWGYWKPYYLAKFGKKRVAGRISNSYGKTIADVGNANFVSWELLEGLGC